MDRQRRLRGAVSIAASSIELKITPLLHSRLLCNALLMLLSAKTSGLVRAAGGTFLFPGSRLFLADIRAQGAQL